MTILHCPAAILFAVALLAAGLGRILKKGLALSYIGGLCWGVGTVAGLVDGASLREILIVTLLLLFISGIFLRRDDTP